MRPLLALAFVLLVLVLVPPFGQSINGTRRWLRWGPSPSSRRSWPSWPWSSTWPTSWPAGRRSSANLWRGVLPPLVVTGGWPGWCCVQPDLGSAVALVGVVLCMMFVAGARLQHMGLIGARRPSRSSSLAVRRRRYRLRRVFAFLDPWADPRGVGFQIIQSYLALGGGGLLGRGLGESKQKLFYLPEPHTDFIFAILGEELGSSARWPRSPSSVSSCGAASGSASGSPTPSARSWPSGSPRSSSTQALVNLGVVVGLLPTKGLPLPFVSFGGSSLLVAMAAVGLLLNISQHAEV